ncbi:small ribosomal subunit protein bS16m [Linepithema humile]|uniref:small ribosomal subunit protein bS16m n=1 Tax=Linepithema humile TaxID=83485 RepID=UPI000623535B|nr:PREDICTED: probable 28S ribosomal protein S16, mitochondrial [Linepithema humile]
MPRLFLHPSSGTGVVTRFQKAIRLARYGCTNRPFYHIVVIDVKKHQRGSPVEQVGTYDPIPNANNEKLISFNYERIQYWIAKGAQISTPIAELLGLAGYLPVHPRSYMKAWRNRRKEKAIAENVSQEQTTASES